jgi:hypothetical protein
MTKWFVTIILITTVSLSFAEDENCVTCHSNECKYIFS